jgi:hypothetical protein
LKDRWESSSWRREVGDGEADSIANAIKSVQGNTEPVGTEPVGTESAGGYELQLQMALILLSVN